MSFGHTDTIVIYSVVDAINLNRFYSSLTRDYLSQSNSALRVFGPYGQQGNLSGLSGQTRYTLSSLYGGQNPYLPNIQVNGNQTSAAALQAYQAGVYGIQSGSTGSARTDAFQLSFNAQGRPTLSTTTPSATAAAFPSSYSDTWIAQRGLSEANLAALLSDPTQTDIVLKQLGLTIQSDGAGNVVNVSDSLNLNEIMPQQSPPNTAEFPLRNIFIAPSNTAGTNTPLTPQATSVNTLASPLNQISLPKNGLEGQGRPVSVGTPSYSTATNPAAITTEQSLQQALLAAAQRSPSAATKISTSTESLPAATVQAFSSHQTGLLAGPSAAQLKQTAAQAHYQPLGAPMSTPAERNGIIPLVQPQAPFNTASTTAGNSGRDNPFSGIQAGIDPNAGGGQGAGLLPQMFAGLGMGGGMGGGGQQQGQQTGTGQPQEAKRLVKRPLSFMA